MTHASIMSYNRDHHLTGFIQPENPGILIPEDLRVLDMNNLAFPDFEYFPETNGKCVNVEALFFEPMYF